MNNDEKNAVILNLQVILQIWKDKTFSDALPLLLKRVGRDFVVLYHPKLRLLRTIIRRP